MKIQILKLPSNRKALGGVLQAHGGDFSNGLTSIEAGSTHENNPYDGVQLGVDLQGTPNLVEEGETVWDDYVFSNRLICDDKTKAMFHISKKVELTFAALSKRLEKESEERPNDPISASALKAQMQDLADQQERQKQEMEAERAEEAFNALSDEEKVALMQQAAEQEQMAQEQAMAEEQATMQQPSPEEMAAMEQQAAMGQQISPEEAAIMQQQMAAQGGMPMREPVPEGYAYGGNLFDEGGYKGALAWLKKKHPNVKNAEAVAKVMANRVKRGSYTGYRGSDPNNKVYFWDSIFEDMLPLDSMPGKANEELFYSLVEDGMDKKLAFEFAMPEKLGYPYNSDKYAAQLKTYRDDAYNRLVANNTPSSSPAQTSVETNQSAVVQQRNQATKFKALDGKTYNTEAEAHAANKVFNGVTRGTTASGIRTRSQKGTTQYLANNNLYYNTEAEALKVNEALKESANSKSEKEVESQKVPEDTSVGDKTKAIKTSTGLNPYGYDPMEGFKYWDAEKEDYNPDYADFINNHLNEDWINRVMSEDSTYGDMSRYKLANAVNPTVSQARQLGLDYKNGDWHKAMARAYEEYKSGIDPVTGQVSAQSAAADAGTQATAPKPFEEEYSMIARPAVQSVAAQYGAPWAPENASTSADAGKAGTTPVTTTTDGRRIVPVTSKLDNLRYAGLFGPAVGLGLWAAGVGKPDTSGLDAAVANAARAYHTASNKYLGNYMKYRPLDAWFTQAKIDAQARATDRAIRNSGVNQGSMIAGFLQNGLNSQLASGEALRADNKYNREDEFKTGEFNRGTDMFNAQAYNQLSQFNADALNRGRQFGASLAMQGAAQKMAADAGWYNSLYGNINGLFKGVSDLGREVSDKNWIARLAASGAIPGIVPENAINASLVKYADTSAEGGKIRKKKGKKKGLTI